VKVAFVHDWLVTGGGGEQVLAEALKEFPGAQVHSVIDHMAAADHERLGIPWAHTTWMQHIPGVAKRYRSLLPLMPTAMRSLDVGDADVVVAISHAVAKAVPVREGQKLLCLCLSPMRYAWDLRDQYLSEVGLDRGVKGVAARWMLERMRRWDLETSARVDSYAAISEYIGDRIARAYGRESTVLYPPVDTEYFGAPGSPTEGRYYVTASRFVPYKRVDLIVRAFAEDGARQLVVIGDGPDDAKVRAAAGAATTIRFIGRADRDTLRSWLRNAQAFVFAAEEDFGIAPVEAQACGVPVIAYGRGGARESIVALDRQGPTGVLFDQQTIDSLRGAIGRFEAAGSAITAAACRANAARFRVERFRRELRAWVDSCTA